MCDNCRPMHLARLDLANFRTFRRLELDLQPGTHVIAAPNARGKTNLLEAIALLATARSARARTDRELISWQALAEDPLPVARIEGRIAARDGATTVEMAVIARAGEPDERPVASRRFRVNGIARRASDVIGRLRVVLFAADDLRIIDGPPAVRRRYLDITISQFDPAYVRALQRYARVLQQRNALLRRLQERRAAGGEIEFWDGELADAGAVIAAARAAALGALSSAAAARYDELAGRRAPLALCYRPAVPAEMAPSIAAPGLAAALRATFEQQRAGDIAAGITRSGPHRDDIEFLLDGRPAGPFASRAEQRTAALALRLAEVPLSTQRTGDPPLLVLDDVLSELDAERRERVLAVAHGVDQLIITTADPQHPALADLPGARRYGIEDGVLVPVAP
ncbi:MAG: DNA replication/repair protein RecF [Dehalococcoidia bacterium]|nr:DNA replication/repair protein RecF [Dehalococcoidia bacterium]